MLAAAEALLAKFKGVLLVVTVECQQHNEWAITRADITTPKPTLESRAAAVEALLAELKGVLLVVSVTLEKQT